MDIVRIRCGMGNQMFCYALYLELLKRGRDARVDLGFYTKYPDWPDPYVLESVFPKIKLEPLDDSVFNSISEKYSEEKRNGTLTQKNTKNSYFWGEPKEQIGVFQPQLFETSNCAFVGVWYSEKYFPSVKDEIRDKFVFKEGEDKLKKLAEKIRNENSVALNIRLGKKYSLVDLTTPIGNHHINISTEGYYPKAIKKMVDLVGSDIKWYVFSDAADVLSGKCEVKTRVAGFNEKDITVTSGAEQYIRAVEQLKRELKDMDITYVTDEMFDNYEDWYDMYLMSCTRNNIIANSSFGWWGAWLNSNPNKVVIGPAKFYAASECTDILPESWIAI